MYVMYVCMYVYISTSVSIYQYLCLSVPIYTILCLLYLSRFIRIYSCLSIRASVTDPSDQPKPRISCLKLDEAGKKASETNTQRQYMDIYRHRCIYIYIYIDVCMYTYIYIHTHTCTYKHTYIYIHTVYMYVCMYTMQCNAMWCNVM